MENKTESQIMGEPELIDGHWYWVRVITGFNSTLEAAAMYRANVKCFYSYEFAGIPSRQAVAMWEVVPPVQRPGTESVPAGGLTDAEISADPVVEFSDSVVREKARLHYSMLNFGGLVRYATGHYEKGWRAAELAHGLAKTAVKS